VTPGTSPATHLDQKAISMQTIQLRVSGMSCASCISSVSRALQQVPGVREVEIDLPRGTASVKALGTTGHTLAAILAALDAAGYGATPLPADQQADAPQPRLEHASAGTGVPDGAP
jgi:copper chaperone CopZ